MSEFAKTACPRCGGAGHWVQETAGKPYTVRCEECKGSGMVEVSSVMTQGCVHYGIRTGATNDPYWKLQPSKTLLDEFAMAAMTGVIACPVDSGFVWRDDPTFGEFIASSSFDIAAAMMKERARRDEIGNVKEVE